MAKIDDTAQSVYFDIEKPLHERLWGVHKTDRKKPYQMPKLPVTSEQYSSSFERCVSETCMCMKID